MCTIITSCVTRVLTGYLGGPEDGQHVAVSRQNLEVDCLKNLVGGVELQEEHDEDPVVGNLLELGGSHVMVDEKDSRNNTQHFVKKIDLKIFV